MAHDFEPGLLGQFFFEAVEGQPSMFTTLWQPRQIRWWVWLRVYSRNPYFRLWGSRTFSVSFFSVKLSRIRYTVEKFRLAPAWRSFS